MKKRTLLLAAITALSLVGCSTNDSTNSSKDTKDKASSTTVMASKESSSGSVAKFSDSLNLGYTG